MALRALRKVMVAFATFDSVAACRACATQSPTSRQPGTAPPQGGMDERTIEGASSEDAFRADVSPDAKP
jgi:hypothetical protein